MAELTRALFKTIARLTETAASLFRTFRMESRAVVVQPKGAYSKLSFWGSEPNKAANASVSYIIKALCGWHSLWLNCIMGVGPFML